MKNLRYYFENEKFWFYIIIFCILGLVYDLAIAVFDVVELILINNNAAELSFAFVGLNISMAIISVVMIIAVVLYLVFRKK